MTLYAASSIDSFTPTEAAFKPGQTCNGHKLGDGHPGDPDYPYLSITCPVCEPLLMNDPHWAGSANERPLTGPEQKAREALRVQEEERRQKMEDARDRALIALMERLEKADLTLDEPEPAPKPRSRTRKPSGASA